MSFTDQEIAYLRSQPLTRFASGPDGQPDVVPLAFEFDGRGFWVGGVGDAVANTRKFRNVAAGNDRPVRRPMPQGLWPGRCARRARFELIGPGLFMRTSPEISWSWNLDGQPSGATWYEARRTTHNA